MTTPTTSHGFPLRRPSDGCRAWAARLGCVAILLLGQTATAAAGELSATVRDDRNKLLADAVVLVTPVDRPIPPLRPGREIVDQVDYEFVPYVKPVIVGSSVSFPNKDNVRHQVYSFSPAKKFELPLYAGTPAAAVVFDKTGVVVLGCNIHDWMIGFIYVADTPYFGKSGGDGIVRLANLPAGEYEVRVWHPRLADSEESTSRRISVGAGTAEESWQLRLKPEFRLRRAPIGGHGGYH
jgi:hypothetical protein